MGRRSPVRLFFALRFSPQDTQTIVEIQERLKTFASSGNYPPAENLHLTLAFFGEVPSSRVQEAQDALEDLSPVPMTLRFSQAGQFPQGNKELWWLGADPCPELIKLREDLVFQLERRNFSMDRRPFLPHITLARKVSFPGKTPRQEDFFLLPVLVSCGRVSLMSSQLTSQGAVYTEIFGKNSA